MANKGKTEKILSAVFLAAWIVALSLPNTVRLVSSHSKKTLFLPFPTKKENRHPRLWPSLRKNSPRYTKPRDLGRALEAWYSDSFAWRTELLDAWREFSFEVLKTPDGRDVPGRGHWTFRRGGDWPELEDWLGAVKLSADDLLAWRDLFEGRREWAAAVGAKYLTMPAPVKAQACFSEMYPALRAHRGRCVRLQIQDALRDSPARDDVIFADDELVDARERLGRPVFFDSDHHPSAYGLWLLYRALGRRLAQLFPGRVSAEPMPWYDEPPEEVLSGRAPGCWAERPGDQTDTPLGIRMKVSSPGERQLLDAFPRGSKPWPYSNAATAREGGGVSLVMAHDSYMRFSLSSWREPEGSLRFPFPEGVGSVWGHIFQRFSIGFLQRQISDLNAVPDVFVEQFPECRLDRNVSRYLDGITRSAAAFARAKPNPEGAADTPPQAGARIVARVVFEELRAAKGDGGAGPFNAVLKAGGRELGRLPLCTGPRQALFFGPLVVPEDVAGEPLAVELPAGISSKSAVVEWRVSAPAPSDTGRNPQ